MLIKRTSPRKSISFRFNLNRIKNRLTTSLSAILCLLVAPNGTVWIAGYTEENQLILPGENPNSLDAKDDYLPSRI